MPQRINVPGHGIVEFPDGMSDAQIVDAIKANPAPAAEASAPAPTPVDPVIDAAKSTGIGLANTGISFAGMGGDARELASNIGTAIGNRLGIPENIQSAIGRGIRWSNPMAPALAVAPTSQEITRAVQGVTGEFYQPQTNLGRYFKTGGEFAAGALLPGGLARRAANVVLPAVASEAAGQALEGRPAEPYARVGAALLGGSLANSVSGGMRAAQRAAIPAAEDRIAKVLKASSEGYESPAITSVEFRAIPRTEETVARVSPVVKSVVDDTLRQLDRAKFNDKRAPATRAVLEDLRTPVSGGAHTIEDLQTAKEQLGHLAGNFANPVEQAAASRAITAITNYIDRMPQSHLAAGDARAASEAWNTARQNYAAGRTAEKVADKLYNADVGAASANTGANRGNQIRQKLRPLLTNAKQARGLTDEESALIENNVRGSRVANALRSMGDATGGGGGVRSLLAFLVGGGATMASGLGPIGFALPFVGSALRGTANAITRRQANNIVDAILSRAPAIEGIRRQGQQILTNQQRQRIAAQLALGSEQVKQPAQQ